MSNFMKIRPVGYAYTEVQTDMTKLTVAILNFANELSNDSLAAHLVNNTSPLS